jgi:hypothetical protein
MWHWSGALHGTVAPAVQTPALQTSFCVHFDPSASHDVPSDFAG